jgi:hypothetical protein
MDARVTVGILGDGVRHGLDRDVAPQAGIACPLDLLHPACADDRLNLEGAERGPPEDGGAGS